MRMLAYIIGSGTVIGIERTSCARYARLQSKKKHRDDWYWYGLIFGVWSLPFIWLSKDLSSTQVNESTLAGNTNHCSSCGCLLSPTMMICPRCKSQV
jgi:hypothetical protein